MRDLKLVRRLMSLEMRSSPITQNCERDHLLQYSNRVRCMCVASVVAFLHFASPQDQ